jgi:hypothetical protein
MPGPVFLFFQSPPFAGFAIGFLAHTIELRSFTMQRLTFKFLLAGLSITLLFCVAMLAGLIATDRHPVNVHNTMLIALCALNVTAIVLTLKLMRAGSASTVFRIDFAILTVITIGLIGWSLYTPLHYPLNIRNPVPGREVCLVPLGSFDAERLKPIEAFFETRYGVTTTIESSVPLPSRLVNAAFGQIDSKWPILMTKEHDGACASQPTNVVLGFTDLDMTSPGWPYIFWHTDGERTGVIAIKRMRDDDETSEDPRNARMRKIATKLLGYVYYKLNASWSIESVLFTGYYGGLDELDNTGEDF